MHVVVVDGRRLCIHGLSLVVAVPPVVLGGEFVLRHDSAAASVRIYGYVLDPCVLTIGAGEAADLDDDEVEEEDGDEALVEYKPLTEEDLAERYDSDSGEDDGAGEAAGESSKRTDAPLVVALAGRVVPDGEILGPARFAAVEYTAGFMRVAAAEAVSGQEGKEILVLYRYARFSRTRSGRRCVEACRRTKLHWLRFAVPPAGDMASSLAWAGSSLGPLIYPSLFRRQLQDLWTSLAAPAINTIPPQAARLQVIVEVGILRREDYTPERMAHMRGALVTRMLHLPEPVRQREEDGGDEDDARPAERSIAEEECCVCFELLESGLAAWPRCGHVFHGECVEKTLARSEMCPLCRHKLSDLQVQKNIKIHSQSAVCSIR